jgi:hypothetical protein
MSNEVTIQPDGLTVSWEPEDGKLVVKIRDRWDICSAWVPTGPVTQETLTVCFLRHKHMSRAARN